MTYGKCSMEYVRKKWEFFKIIRFRSYFIMLNLINLLTLFGVYAIIKVLLDVAEFSESGVLTAFIQTRFKERYYGYD